MIDVSVLYQQDLPASSCGRWGFAALAELSPQLFQSIEESLPSRFNRMAAHDVPPRMRVAPRQVSIRRGSASVRHFFECRRTFG